MAAAPGNRRVVPTLTSAPTDPRTVSSSSRSAARRKRDRRPDRDLALDLSLASNGDGTVKRFLAEREGFELGRVTLRIRKLLIEKESPSPPIPQRPRICHQICHQNRHAKMSWQRIHRSASRPPPSSSAQGKARYRSRDLRRSPMYVDHELLREFATVEPSLVEPTTR